MRNQEEKIELQKKVHRRIWLHVFLLLVSVAFFVCFNFTKKKNVTPENGEGRGGAGVPPPNFCGGPAEWTIFCNNEEVFVAVYLIIIVSPQ